MDFQVVEVERAIRLPAFGEYQNLKLNESSSQVSNNQVDDWNEKPYVGMEFNSEESAKNCYDAYARRVGFSSHVGQYTRTKPDGSIVSLEFACSREIFKRKNVESCNAMLCIKKKIQTSGVVSMDENRLSCESNLVASVETNETVRNQSTETNPAVGSASSTETNLATMNSVPMMSLHFISGSSRRIFGKDAQNLLPYFRKMQAENPGFYYAIQLDNDNFLSNVFWADARSRMAYSHFGDAVVFDTMMYRPNQFQVPLAPFTGVNHHGQMVLFDCALLMDESDASFAWVFKTWLSAINNKPPVYITTDQDRAIKAAVHQAFPETHHCICKWHILREGQERLVHTCIAHPSFYGEFYSCINFVRQLRISRQHGVLSSIDTTFGKMIGFQLYIMPGSNGLLSIFATPFLLRFHQITE